MSDQPDYRGARGNMFGGFWRDSDSYINKKCVNGQISVFFSLYIQNEASCDNSTAKLTGCFVSWAHSKYIWSFYRHNKYGQCMQKIKADRAQEQKHIAFCLLQSTQNIQHMYMRSPILVVTLHAALKSGSTVPAGWIKKNNKKTYFDRSGKIWFFVS